MTQKLFTVLPKHIKLLKRMYVSWDDCEYGAPGIDPKKPYGNSSVGNDIHYILTGEKIGYLDSKRDELTPEEEDKYYEIHQEMETVLQIFLYNLGIKPGTYVAEEHTREWKPLRKGKK